MYSPGPKTPSRLLAYTAAVCLAACWLLIFVFALTCVFVIIATVLRLLPVHLNIGQTGNHIVLAWYWLLVVCGVSYNGLALLLRCHHCGHRFLYNPKALGPAFTDHVNCPDKKGFSPFSPWTKQIVEFLIRRRIRCVNCGKEIFP